MMHNTSTVTVAVEYSINGIIHSGVITDIYRTVEPNTNTKVILKVIKQDYPTLEAIARLKHEYAITAGIDHEHIVKTLRLENKGDRYAIVFEDFGGISLKKYLETNQSSLQLTLQVAIAISKALIYIHNHNIIHKDIKPANIIIENKQANDTFDFHPLVKLTDFSIASFLQTEVTQQSKPDKLEGTLSYLSPEQTGRMNRNVDCRSDFYSLGVTLYEMLTGQLPFIEDDPLELIHAHIAQQPIPIQQINPNIPSAVCAIVEKLMAKNAEDRYQSAKGLLADLEKCWEEFQATGQITDFTPGQLEVISQLFIPQKLYGREIQLKSLLEAFTRINTGNRELTLVSGYSGIGKTSLINEINKPITKAKGYFISGKSDQFKRDIPYASLIQAFTSLCEQLLTESPERLDKWRGKIQKAVGRNGQVIINIIPEVELIIGKQPELPELEATEAQNRFNFVFRSFVQVFASKKHPLVIFLDDLQWADSGTLKLIQLLITDYSIEYLLIIGAYRDNEVNPAHPLMATIEEIEQNQTVRNIVLEPLSINHVLDLVAETLHQSPENCQSLAQLIFNKTTGNPFFITQLLQVLNQDSLLVFDFNQQKWSWNLDEIQTVGIADKSVVELVVSRVDKLPKSTKQILQLAACIGSKFHLDVLSRVSKNSIYETAKRLNIALQAGLILPLSENYRTPLLFGNAEKSENLENISSFDSKKIIYKFLHDRVQQAAYSLIPDNQKSATHLQIGQILKASSNPTELEDNILDIVNQLNLGVELLNSSQEKYELANLNLIAGKKAKKNSAFTVASKYFHAALDLAGKDIWQHNYNFALDLYSEAAEAEYLCGNFDKSQEIADFSLKQCEETLEKVRFYEIKVQSYTSIGEMNKGLEVGLIALKELGINFPKKVNNLSILSAVFHTKIILTGKRIEDLLYLPIMKDPHKLATIKILMLIAPVASQSGSLIFILMSLAMVRLSVRYGNSIYSAYAYSGYGVMLCDKLGDINSGYNFGLLGIQLLSKMQNNSLKTRVYMLFYSMIKYFKDTINETIPNLIEGMQSGRETGDLIFSNYNAFFIAQHLFFANKELDSLTKEIIKYIEITDNNSKTKPHNLGLKVLLQTVFNLQDLSQNKLILIGDAFNEKEMPPAIAENSTMMSHFNLCKASISYLFGDYNTAVKSAQEVQNNQETNPCFLMYQINNLYYSLSLLANWKNVTEKEQKKYINQLEINQKQMKRWSHHASCNFQNKYELVEAEKARLFGRNNLAANLYDKAIAGARENNFIAEEALANELAAKFYIEQGKDKFAKVYMTDAYYAYVKWGAFAKVKDLEEKYPEYILRSNTPIQGNTISETKTTVASTSYSQTLPFDTSTLIKSSLALSSEVVLEELIGKLMHLVKVNGGAERVLFIAKNQDELVLEASLNEKNEMVVLQSLPINIQNNSQNLLPISLINYVKRTQKPVVLDDATNKNNFQDDPYIITNRPKSVLASPIMHNGKMGGILYLENNLTNNAFTKDRLEILKILSAQAAVSLENARFYSTLEARVQERTQQLQEKNQELQTITQQLQTALQELKHTQSQLVHNEKMSSLGQLVAGIAHEINNPINFIYGNLAHTATYVESLLELIDLYQENCHDGIPEIDEMIEEIDLPYIREDIPNLLNSMRTGAARVRDIVKSLRIFSRLDEASIKKVDIHESIDSTLMILVQRLANIQVIKEYGNLPAISCYAGELNQVFLNIITNAIDAITIKVAKEVTDNSQGKYIPTIRIITGTHGENMIKIQIADNGVGISNEIKDKIFDPFFTTKDVGQGTGMGLSICYQIITDKHKGSLEFMSSREEGTAFMITIPSTL